jgi:hypothetical protein
MKTAGVVDRFTQNIASGVRHSYGVDLTNREILLGALMGAGTGAYLYNRQDTQEKNRDTQDKEVEDTIVEGVEPIKEVEDEVKEKKMTLAKSMILGALAGGTLGAGLKYRNRYDFSQGDLPDIKLKEMYRTEEPTSQRGFISKLLFGDGKKLWIRPSDTFRKYYEGESSWEHAKRLYARANTIGSDSYSIDPTLVDEEFRFHKVPNGSRYMFAGDGHVVLGMNDAKSLTKLDRVRRLINGFIAPPTHEGILEHELGHAAQIGAVNRGVNPVYYGMNPVHDGIFAPNLLGTPYSSNSALSYFEDRGERDQMLGKLKRDVAALTGKVMDSPRDFDRLMNTLGLESIQDEQTLQKRIAMFTPEAKRYLHALWMSSQHAPELYDLHKRQARVLIDNVI